MPSSYWLQLKCFLTSINYFSLAEKQILLFSPQETRQIHTLMMETVYENGT